jgi:hypothetical protein
MVLVSVTPQGANTRLARYETGDKTLKTHETVRPTAAPEDVEAFRRSPSTHLRFGFANPGEARVRGFTMPPIPG